MENKKIILLSLLLVSSFSLQASWFKSVSKSVSTGITNAGNDLTNATNTAVSGATAAANTTLSQVEDVTSAGLTDLTTQMSNFVGCSPDDISRLQKNAKQLQADAQTLNTNVTLLKANANQLKNDMQTLQDQYGKLQFLSKNSKLLATNSAKNSAALRNAIQNRTLSQE